MTVGRFHRRIGFTLLELLLVLALVAIIAAMATPLLWSSIERTKLENGADIIRAEWGRARVKAMKTGRIHVFRYEIGTSQYRVEPLFGSGEDAASADDSLLTQQDRASSGANPGGAAQSGAEGNPSDELFGAIGDGLPTGVTFVSAQINDDSRSVTLDDAGSGAAASVSGETGEPIYFYPDGTTSTVEMVLVNRRNTYISVMMRGLTGVVRVSEVMGEGNFNAAGSD